MQKLNVLDKWENLRKINFLLLESITELLNNVLNTTRLTYHLHINHNSKLFHLNWIGHS